MQVWGGLPCQAHYPLKCHISSQELGKETVLRLEAHPAPASPRAVSTAPWQMGSGLVSFSL